MTIEQLQQFEKYYLPDSEISPDDLEYIMANSQQVKHYERNRDHDTDMAYDIRDYLSMHACCCEIDNERREYAFSARYRCIKYKDGKHHIKFVDFTGVPFAPQGDELSHMVKVGDYTFSADLPFQYNFLIILLKWSDLKMEAGELPIDSQITASPVFISEEIQNRYGLDVDLDSRVPLAVGFGEYSVLDYRHVLPLRSVCGGLCFYIAEHFKPCISINEASKIHRIIGPAPRISVFESPYEKSYGTVHGYYLSNKAKAILGNENDLTLYVISEEAFEEKTIMLHLFSLRDYYSVASWLIVALSYCFCGWDEKYVEINKYWPSCPILQDYMAKRSLWVYSTREKIPKYVNILKPFYTTLRKVLKAYTGVRKDEYNTQHQSMEDLFVSECVALVDALSSDYFVPCGQKMLNDLFGTEYKLDEFRAIMDRVAIKRSYAPLEIAGNSDLVEFVCVVDILSIELGVVSEPASDAIINFYKLLGKLTIDICVSDKKRNEYMEMLDRWLSSLQKNVEKLTDEDQRKAIRALYDISERNSKERIADNNEDNSKDTPDGSSTDSQTETDDNASSDEDTSDADSTDVQSETDDNGSVNKDTPDGSSADVQSEADDNASASEEPGGPSSARQELDSLVGLDSIKADVINLISLVKVQQLRKSKGFKSAPVSLHLVFTGNPGTGKTTVARILAQLYKEIGVLKTGQVVEVDRADLVAGYVGQTALKTQEKINEAMGGVLFIDEAYTLAKEGNDFGQEAIDTILKEMEDSRGEFIVIVAGYDEPMKKFIDSNPGLKSRFNKYFHFPDYTADELIIIFKTMLKKYDYSITDSAMDTVTEKIIKMEQQKERNFANARDVRNYFEQIIARQASRVSELPDPTDTEILEITVDDV